ncbi:MAG: hypothetical protein RLZZ522_1536 [Verrucomicrobiota bacterium]
MKYSILFAIGLAMILPLQAAGNGTKRKPCPKPCPERAFKRKDKDHDGMLTKEEFIAKAKDAAKAGERFTKRDKDSDGKLTRAEFRGKRAKTAKTKPAGARKAGAKKAAKKAERAQKNK